MKFLFNKRSAEKAAANPLYTSFLILDESLILGFSKPKTVNLSRPFLTGFSILELSKYHMYRMFYQVILPRIPRARVGFSDTDSWLLSLPGRSPEEAMRPLRQIMDYSNLHERHPLYSDLKKSFLGYLKEENSFQYLVVEACLIRAKCYSLKLVPRKPYEASAVTIENLRKEEIKHLNYSKCKGAKKSSVKKLSFDEYYKVLMNPQNYYGEQTVIRSLKHTIYTVKQTKRFFQTFDDKTFLKNCGIHSVPYFHYSILDDTIDANYCDKCKK